MYIYLTTISNCWKYIVMLPIGGADAPRLGNSCTWGVECNSNILEKCGIPQWVYVNSIGVLCCMSVCV